MLIRALLVHLNKDTNAGKTSVPPDAIIRVVIL